MNYFDSGDLVECVQAFPGVHGYIVGAVYSVIDHGGGPYIPDPRARTGVGLSCGYPWITQHFKLFQKAATGLQPSASIPNNLGPQTPPQTPPQTVSIGDAVEVLDISGSGLPATVLGDLLPVTATGPLSASGRYVEVDYNGVAYTLMPFQYLKIGVYRTITAPKPAAIVNHVAQLHAVVAEMQAMNDLSTIRTIPAPRSPRCECGSEAVKSPQHSSWCPKHRNEG